MRLALFSRFLIFALFYLTWESLCQPHSFFARSARFPLHISIMENIETGLLLMAVGMTTVFAILLLVINLGKGLIALVNKYAPEDIVVKKQSPVQTHPSATRPATDITGPTTAAIISAVSVVTRGQGKVTKIEKL